jgi:TPP-dependent indolepyruvate ferredoxin oxidoreductase alpha subunit
MNPKVKLPKEKKNSQKNSITPKKSKKKVHFSNTKEKEKDTSQKNNIIKSKVPPLVEEKKNDKIEKTNIIQPNNAEQKNNIDEAQNTSSNLKENKDKRNWKSWSPQEKILFYEIIANGGNYSSLQKLFKTMNDVSIN